MKRILIPFCLFVTALRADVILPAIFSDHAVLQKSDNVPVWGKAEPGEAITVALDGVAAKAVASADGKWITHLDLSAKGPGPYELTVRGNNLLSVQDVLVGEVWACTGQSNMAFPLRAFVAVAKKELPVSANPLLRQFLVPLRTSPTPLDDLRGKWTVAGPATAGDFSATAYFFGKQLQARLGVPVGLINSSIGGTVIETWMSAEAFAGDPVLKAGAEKARRDRQAFDDYADHYRAWQKQHDRMDRPTTAIEAFTGAAVDTTGWTPVTLPGFFAKAGLPEAGAIWIRRTISVPSADIGVGKGIDLYLGDIQGANAVYWNGRKVAQSDHAAGLRRYNVRGNGVTAGKNILAVRIFNSSAGAGIKPGRARFQGNHFMLAGEWLAKVETALPALSAVERQAVPVRPNAPIETPNVASYLFNGMINPLIPYAIRGFIWYQGEGNWQRGYQYRTAFPLMIADWRAKWGRGDLPFYYCQLANFQDRSPQPGESPFADVRESQSLALSVPNTGQAVLIDIGEEKDIHPADKQSVGDRLARIALAKTYGRTEIVYSGPVHSSMAVEGGRIRIAFSNTEGGLVARPLPATYQPLSKAPATVPLVRNSPEGELEGFALCGADRQWKWATAKIEGTTVVVWNPAVPAPVAVRYAWAQNPVCNLYNGAGLPASPFRTDDFPLPSVKSKY